VQNAHLKSLERRNFLHLQRLAFRWLGWCRRVFLHESGTFFRSPRQAWPRSRQPMVLINRSLSTIRAPLPGGGTWAPLAMLAAMSAPCPVRCSTGGDADGGPDANVGRRGERAIIPAGSAIASQMRVKTIGARSRRSRTKLRSWKLIERTRCCGICGSKRERTSAPQR
jgi:hypothetical protein